MFGEIFQGSSAHSMLWRSHSIFFSRGRVALQDGLLLPSLFIIHLSLIILSISYHLIYLPSHLHSHRHNAPTLPPAHTPILHTCIHTHPSHHNKDPSF